MAGSTLVADRPTKGYEHHASKDYYHFVRREIAPLLPANASSALEVGAASGATLRWLKTFYPAIVTTGVELNGDVLSELEKNVDVAVIGPIEEVIPQLKTYDVILLLDVLEHLVDSLGALKKICALLNPGGTIVVSLPNVAHFSVSVPLILRRDFPYADAGILDRTHMRFFTEKSCIGLLNEAGLTVTEGVIAGIQGPKSKLFDLITLGFLRHHLTKQYIMAARRTGATQGAVKWTPMRES